MSKEQFTDIVDQYGGSAIIHITGGEPSVVPWLYEEIDKHPDVRFHLNSNAYVKAPQNIDRFKVSLDSMDPSYFDGIVGVRGAFDSVVANIKEASKRTVTSITCTLTKENYREAPEFMKFCKESFPDLYAVFFSVYKGNSERFAFGKDEALDFFHNIKPQLEVEMDAESLALINETIDEKKRIMKGVRFPENEENIPCYISMSERVFDHTGSKYMCSHLFRDNIFQTEAVKHSKCLYGCNRRLVAFNQEVSRLLGEQS